VFPSGLKDFENCYSISGKLSRESLAKSRTVWSEKLAQKKKKKKSESISVAMHIKVSLRQPHADSSSTFQSHQLETVYEAV
jgi:hypothetical protein